MAAEEVAMAYALGAVERAMKVQEVILRAVDGKLTWLQAADILGRSPRSIRRLRWKLEHFGYDGLFDRRRQTPSPKRAPLAEIQHLHAVLERHGLPMALYTDRAHWAAHTPTAGGAVDRRHPTQVGRALARLGIEHILGYSPQARGRSERANRTLQGRLVNELRLAGIDTVGAANRYLRDHFMPAFNAEFGRAPADPASAFVPLARVDLEQILCIEEERVVGRDNVVTADGLP